MKQAELVLKGFDIEIVADGLEQLLLCDHKLRSDKWNAHLLALSLQINALCIRTAPYADVDLRRAAWPSEFLRRALLDAALVPDLQQRIKSLEADIKQAKKQAPKPKRRPVKKAPAPIPTDHVRSMFPAARTPEEVTAALDAARVTEG